MPESMYAVVNYAPEPDSVDWREAPIPDIGPDEVLLQVEAVGVCGSDLHQWKGTHSWHVNYPCTLGHEFGGVVARSGRNVRAFREGDRVVSETAAVINPDSPLTRQGLYNLDPARKGFGYGVNGAMTSYVRVPERCLHHVPDTLSMSVAALTEPCCVAYNAVCVNGRMHPGDSVVVLGPGPIGLLCAMMAELSGAGAVVVAGLPADDRRLEVARAIGARTAYVDAVAEEVKAFGDGMGADVVVDAAGVSASLKLALDLVRPAGQIVKVGWGPQPLGFSLDALVLKNITLQGSFSHNWPIWERVLNLLASGRLDPRPLIGREAPLQDWQACFEGMHAGRYVKTVLKPDLP